MAVNFGKKGKAKASADAPSFLKKGKVAQQEQEKVQKLIDARKDEIQRHWMAPDDEHVITFLSGIVEGGIFVDVPMWYEHQLYLDGNWRNWFVCVNEEEPCPICEGGDQSKLVAGFTIIDHTPFTTKDGKVYKDNIKILVCKAGSLKILQKLAIKRKGLQGCTFDVSRTADDAANVGDMFDFSEKRTIKALSDEFGTKDKKIEPFNFQDILVYRPALELRTMGFGTQEKVADTTDYSTSL